MFSRSAEPTEVLSPVAERRRSRPERAAESDAAAGEQGSPLTRSALAFAVRCHAGRRRDSDDAPLIEHPLEVARLLRAAGCSAVLVAAGLLHHVVENAEVGATELGARFGKEVADLVMAVTDDASVHSYRRRKQVQYFQRIRLDHHELSLRMLQSAVPQHPLVIALADELAHCPIETCSGER